MTIDKKAPDRRQPAGTHIYPPFRQGEVQMNHDFIKLASDWREAHALGVPYRLPAMTMRELAVLLTLLDDTPASATLH